METLFPLGISHYLIGGILVGVGIGFIYLMTGLVSGASTVFTSTWSYVFGVADPDSFFNRKKFIATRSWRLTLICGLVLGGLIYTFLANDGLATVSTLSPWLLFFGGIFVGIGTRMASGCPSGHAICGNAMLQRSSVVSTVTFLVVAILVASLIRTLI